MYRHEALIEWAREREYGSAHEARHFGAPSSSRRN
jgi:hypothetical protein